MQQGAESPPEAIQRGTLFAKSIHGKWWAGAVPQQPLQRSTVVRFDADSRVHREAAVRVGKPEKIKIPKHGLALAQGVFQQPVKRISQSIFPISLAIAFTASLLLFGRIPLE